MSDAPRPPAPASPLHPEDDGLFTRRMVRTVLTVTTVGLMLTALYVAREAVMLIYVSALAAMGFAPLVKWIEAPQRRFLNLRVPRVAAILVIYVTILTGFGLVALAVLPPLIDQASELWVRLPVEFDRAQQFLVEHKLMAGTVTLQEAVRRAPNGAGASAVNAVNTVLFALWSLVGGLFGLVTILILSFYLLLESEDLMTWGARFVPEHRRASVMQACRRAVAKVSAWLGAQVVLALVMGVFAAVGLGLMRVPYFYVIALIAAVGETIPIVGPLIAGVSAVVIAIGSAPKLAVLVGGYFLVLHQLEANILVPKIMERRVGVSPVTVMVALLIGGALWGLVGAILAIPTAAILSVAIEEFV